MCHDFTHLGDKFAHLIPSFQDTPKSHSDIFHFLCDSNMVNAYVNQCMQHGRFTDKQVQRMYQAKRKIFSTVLRLAETHNPNVRITLNSMPAALVNMNVEKRSFQFSFRGMTEDMLDRLIKTGINCNGSFEGHYNQPFATEVKRRSSGTSAPAPARCAAPWPKRSAISCASFPACFSCWMTPSTGWNASDSSLTSTDR